MRSARTSRTLTALATIALLAIALLAIALSAATAVAVPHPLDSLKPGEWYEVPSSKLSAVVQQPTAP